jgi:hypothetical protein
MPGGLLSQLLVLVLLPFRRCRRRRAGIRRFLAKGFGWPLWLLALAAGGRVGRLRRRRHTWGSGWVGGVRV